MAQIVKNLPDNAGNMRDVSLTPGLGRSLGGGHGNPLQYSGLENPMDGEAWQDATVHRVTKSRTWLKRQHARTRAHTCVPGRYTSRHGIADSIDKCIYNSAGH